MEQFALGIGIQPAMFTAWVKFHQNFTLYRILLCVDCLLKSPAKENQKGPDPTCFSEQMLVPMPYGMM